MSTGIVILIVVIIVVVAVALGLRLRSRAANDGVDSFRRQIDALSPEARKPTVDQVKSAERSDGDERADGLEGWGRAGHHWPRRAERRRSTSRKALSRAWHRAGCAA